MPSWRVRDFHDDDLDQAIHLWDQSREGGEPVFSAAEVLIPDPFVIHHMV